ncbi:Ig-specific serine endopeptidase MIP [Mesomycoplasma hyopneumoniae]|uniref:Ig-specific serine endopeptidase MIP n=1 Tax=Mesomycoplasma hyopneumoniae TaxID=2099 RepID=UPI001F384FA9|nr:DUF31 family protein [Mesomycoplasma hyopneumoniae]UIF66992.1 DUF31 family protein [Mesomycoplasma hyopneumoniae]
MKKKANFKLLLTKNWIIPSIFSFPFLISAACSSQKQQENKDSLDQNGQDLDKKEQKPAPSILKDQEITKENLDKLPIILKKIDGSTNFENLTIESVGNDFSRLEFETPNEDDQKLIDIKVLNKKYLNSDFETSLNEGALIFNLKITSKKNPEIVLEKDVPISGFRKSRSSEINFNYGKRFAPDSDNEWSQYFAKNNYQRYTYDAKKYMETLEKQLAYISGLPYFDIKSWRPEVKRNQEQINKYNEKAKELKLDSYEDALKKGFTMPVYDANGNVEGLKLLDRDEIPKGPAWWDLINRNENQASGLARYIPNEKYKKAALQTYSVYFAWPATIDDVGAEYIKPFLEGQRIGANPMQQTSRGTMWILDFAPPTDLSQQPTKWYFGTNNHVVESYKKNASHFSMTILKPEVGIRTKLKTAKGASDESYLTASFSRENLEQNAKTDNPQNKTAEYISPDDYGIPGIRIIYRATDFMTTSPKDFLSEADKKNEKYKDIEEFADFAVIEVDFSKFKVPDQYSSRNDFIKAITNDYYNKKEDHIKFLKTSYLKNYEKADTKLATTDNSKKENTDQLFIVGYPQATGDFFLDKYQDSYDYNHSKIGYSLWMNSESSFYNNLDSDENNPESKSQDNANKGNYFSLNIGYRSFADKPGLADGFITVPKVGKELSKSTIMADPVHKKQVKKEVIENGQKIVKDLGELDVLNQKAYLGYGLYYIPRHFAPHGGASGSSIRNQNNELVGVYFVSNQTAKTGLAVAFRSEGFDYKGLYGKYNLPQYDLIYGGGKEQKTSFRQALETIYGSEFKTNLFKNGVKEIPADYKFNNSNSNSN